MIRWLERGVRASAVLACAGLADAAEALRVSSAWARATPPGAQVGAVYLRIDGAAAPDRLLGGSSPRARSVGLHEVEVVSGVSRMRPRDGLDIPAGARVELAPQGLHLMLVGLETPLRAGETVPLTLRFERAGEVTIRIEVRATTAGNGSGAQH